MKKTLLQCIEVIALLFAWILVSGLSLVGVSTLVVTWSSVGQILMLISIVCFDLALFRTVVTTLLIRGEER